MVGLASIAFGQGDVRNGAKVPSARLQASVLIDYCKAAHTEGRQFRIFDEALMSDDIEQVVAAVIPDGPMTRGRYLAPARRILSEALTEEMDRGLSLAYSCRHGGD